MNINLIWAQANNRVIGLGNALPWHLPEDLAHFKQLTQGQIVLMGRKTWDSLPDRFRPLPGRTNWVVSSQAGFAPQGAVVFQDVNGALQSASKRDADVWVMGGASVYTQTIALAHRLEVTEIDMDVQGDAWAPAIDTSSWQCTMRTEHVSATGLKYAFCGYERKTM